MSDLALLTASPIPAFSYEPFHEYILRHIRENAQKCPNKTASLNEDNPKDRVTFGEFYDRCLSVCGFLECWGFREGDISCVVSANCWQFGAIVMGVLMCGGIHSGCNAAFTEFELERQLADGPVRVVFCDTATLPKVLNVRQKIPQIELIVLLNLSDTVSVSLPSDVVDIQTVFRHNSPLKQPRPAITVDSVAILPYSSGTTGQPKGVMITHRNLVSYFRCMDLHSRNSFYPHIDPTFDPLRESLLNFLPQYHVFGFGLTFLSLLHGYTGVYLRKYQPEKFLRALQNHKIRFIHLVPPIAIMLAKHPAVQKYDLRNLRTIYCSAAPLDRAVESELRRRLGVKSVAQGYGMTEMTLAVFRCTYSGGDPFGSAGKLVGLMEAKIVDVESGKIVKRGKRGEICVRGPMVMKGYWRNEKATKETIDSDGWLHSGDIGIIDQSGYLFVVDRMKELIKVKGLQVAPAELEGILLGHSAISDVCVIGVPDPNSGQLPKAFIVRRNPQLTIEEIHRYINERVSPYKRLKGGVEFVDEIPKSPSGKILRRKLRERSHL